ncbi:MAG: hypothetical protein KIT09_33500 [Bryobacteraceae bacterium]|nr:hypothetical protein [Bryobacteraceae bacterium]
MRLLKALAGIGIAVAAAGQPATQHQDPDGFRLQLPSGWKVRKYSGGQIVAAAPDPAEWVLIAPVLPRTRACAVSLESNLGGGWQAYPGVKNLNVRAVRPGLALADFHFHDGQSRGAVLCAETGPRTGMLYGMAAPAGRFPAARDRMLAVLRSFQYGGAAPANAAAPAGAALPMEPWRDPTESALSALKPAGWRVEGGVVRISNTDVRTGFRLTSTDGRSAFILGDARLNSCMVPGPNMMQYTNQAPAAGKDWCPYRTGEQVAEMYAQRILASDLGIQGLRITGRRPRPDLTAAADRLASIAGPSSFRNATGEVTFEGNRGGLAVSGKLIANTLMLYSPAQDLMAGTYTQDINGYIGPRENDALNESLLRRVQGSIQWNLQWVMANRAAGVRDTEMVRRYLAESAKLGQQMYEDRTAAAARRADAVGDLLSGQVRLKDTEGNQYTARAGSNYYFLDEEQARVAARPDDAVVGRDVWKDRGAVDLRPLEIVK